MKRTLVKTSDGSFTVKVEEIDEHYHSIHGAVQESNHVFIKNGVDAYLQLFPELKSLSILEIGFGTGLNALLSAIWAKEHRIHLRYAGIEAYPIGEDLIESLSANQVVSSQDVSSLFKNLHSLDWNVYSTLNPYFECKKIHADVFTYLPNEKFQILFFDAFGPRAQQEMWEFSFLQKVTDCLVESGLFVTYCAQGQLKRNLKALHFDVSSPKGPPGKREMVVAQKKK